MDRLSEKRTGRLDKATVIILAAVFFVCALCSITDGCYWGDDYAAYISEGIAIAEGNLDRQAMLNTEMHPSPLPDEAVGKPLVYVWGYPLILALVYRIVGFDRVTYASIFFYKLPTVIAFALIAAALFLFLRKRFGYFFSLLLTAAFCACSEFYNFINTLYSDVYFMFFSLLALYLVELYTENKDCPYRLKMGIILGVILWYTYEIRLNGLSILLACLGAHIIYLIKNRAQFNRESLLREAVPYIIFFIFKSLSELIIALPTSNISDFQDTSLVLFIGNLRVYLNLILDFFRQIWGSILINPLYSVLRRMCQINYSDLAVLSSICAWASVVLVIIGLVRCGIRNNLHLSLLAVLYIIIASTLPYTQGMRYIYPILPVILLFFGYGAKCVIRLPDNETMGRIKSAAVPVMCLLCLYQVASSDIKLQANGRNDTEIVNVEDIYMQNAYSDCAVEAYNYIRANTPEDCTIAFFAPRGLYLNTERFSIKPDVNGHSINEADYYLDYLKTGGYCISPTLGDEFESVFSNDEFVFYKRIKDFNEEQ
jgi:hypothetical protein